MEIQKAKLWDESLDIETQVGRLMELDKRVDHFEKLIKPMDVQLQETSDNILA